MRLHGRSSSHFTRITRIFARELEIEVEFLPIRNLMSTDPDEFGGNPALKLPTLESPDGRWFGSLPICRELARHSQLNLDIVWPEQLETALASDVQEMVTTAMSSEVLLVLGKGKDGADESGYQAKLRASLLGTMAWLEENAGPAFSSLPAERDLSYVEVSLFCLVEHLPFREVLDTTPFPRLRGFAERFARRSSAKATPYAFDFQK